MEAIPRKSQYLTAILPLVEEKPDDEHATERISFQLKMRAGTAASSATYNISVCRFNEGSVHQWIVFRQNLEEIWTQNAVTSPSDRLASVRGILRGESLNTFNTSIEESRNSIDEDGVATAVVLSVEGVFAGIQSVAETVFPYKALVNQKLWMRKVLKKPKELSFRKTVSAVGRLNNSLPLFPKGSVADKFSAAEILEILEWSIPGGWRQKFDSQGYTPSEHGKARLLTECEIIERSEPKPTKPVVTKQSTGKEKSPKKAYVSNGSTKSTKKGGFYCTEHGENPTHNTSSCYVLAARAKKADGSTDATMTKKSFRREIHLLSKKQPKKKVLEMYAAVISAERAKSSKKKKALVKAKKRKAKAVEMSDSDSSVSSTGSIHVMTEMEHLKSQLSKSKRAVRFNGVKSKKSDESTEENSYKKRIESLGEKRDANETSESI